MSGEDADLGSFFAEIEQITHNASNDNLANKETEVISSAPVLARSVTYSKPAEIREDIVKTWSSYEYKSYEGDFSADYYNSHGSSYATTSSNPLANMYAQSAAPEATKNPVIARQQKKFVRKAADEVWVDDSLQEWPENDFRIFVGDLGKDITTEMLTRQFQSYKSFAKAKVIRDKHDNKPKGYGFVSFLDADDCIKAMREMNGKYLGARPMKIRRSTWADRDIGQVKKKEQKKRKIQESLGLA